MINDRLPDHNFGEEPVAVMAYVDGGGAMGTDQRDANETHEAVLRRPAALA